MAKEEDIRDLTPEFVAAIRRKLYPFSKEKENFNKAIMPAIEKLDKHPDKEGQKFKIIRADLDNESAFLGAVEYKNNALYFWTNKNSGLYAIKDDGVDNLTINFSNLTEAIDFLGDWVADVAPDIADKTEKEASKISKLNFP